MKPTHLLFLSLLASTALQAQTRSGAPLTFQSNPIRLNTRPLFAAKTPETSTAEAAPKKAAETRESPKTTASAKPSADWRSTGDFRMADHFVASNWQKINGNAFTETVRGPQCRIRMSQTDRPGMYVIDMPLDFKQNDFLIEVVLEERSELPTAGLAYGLADKDNYYSFLINSKGEYQVDGMLEGESLGLMPRFVKSPAIDPKGPNTLGIEKKGNQVRYLINGTKVYENRFIDFAGTRMGYYAQSPDVSFNGFKVKVGK